VKSDHYLHVFEEQFFPFLQGIGVSFEDIRQDGAQHLQVNVLGVLSEHFLHILCMASSGQHTLQISTHVIFLGFS
jgi:hypothetical protein